jgi:hypothetical protein
MATGTVLAPRFARRPDWERDPRPHGMFTATAAGPDGYLYAFGGGRPGDPAVPACVTVYDRDGRVVRTWGERAFVGTRPHGITIDDGAVYLVEDVGCRVRRFTLDGREQAVIGPSGEQSRSDTGVDWAEPNLRARLAMIRPDGAGPFNHPTALAVGPSGDLYVSDGYGNCKVHRFAADGTNLSSWGRSGTGRGEFHLPHGITADGDRLLVCDRENDRVQVFGFDGAYAGEWAGLHRPENVAIGPDGLYYAAEGYEPAGHRSFAHPPAAEARAPRISVRDAAGVEVGHVDLDFRAHHVSVDRDGHLYCCPSTAEADSRIVRFDRVG